jgi:hypothetical protein
MYIQVPRRLQGRSLVLSFLAPWEGLVEEARAVLDGGRAALRGVVLDERQQDREYDLGERFIEVELDATVGDHDRAARTHDAAGVHGVLGFEQLRKVVLNLAGVLAGLLTDGLLASGVCFVVGGPVGTGAEVLRREQAPLAPAFHRDPQVTRKPPCTARKQAPDTGRSVLDGLPGQVLRVSAEHWYLQLCVWLCQVSPRWKDPFIII